MSTEAAEGLVVRMCGKGRADRLSVLLAPDLLAAHGEDLRQFTLENVDLLLAEQSGEQDPAFGVELLQLLLCKFHSRPAISPLESGQSRPGESSRKRKQSTVWMDPGFWRGR